MACVPATDRCVMKPEKFTADAEQNRADAPISLEFSKKYDSVHSKQYFEKHHATLARRLSHWKESRIARRALQTACEPRVVLDLPCGAGRFWPLLADRPDREILAADISADMIRVALESQPPGIAARVKAFQTSAFAIEAADASVDLIFCIRLLHHVQSSEHRVAMLREFRRVTRASVILSLWVDGNFKSWRRQRLERRRIRDGKANRNDNRFVVSSRQIEGEFSEAGFRIVNYYDFIPKYAMWRTYVLEKA